jgi:catechol 2,3-dioxygenase-like lactoylglutathione lyase family enzyme
VSNSSSGMGAIRSLGPIGLSVRDIERSARFYAALGFELGERVPVPASGANALGARGANARLVMQRIWRDGAKLLLLQLEPAPSEPGRGAAAQLGLTHLEMFVDDIDSVAAEIARMGGAALNETRATLADVGPEPLHMMFCRDPDGTLIALVKQTQN